jgi:hypothetical protein
LQIDRCLRLRRAYHHRRIWTWVKIPKSIDVGEWHFSLSELKNASDSSSFIRQHLGIGRAPLQQVNCEKDQT